MAVDTFIAYIGVYDDVADAEADYDLVKELRVVPVRRDRELVARGHDCRWCGPGRGSGTCCGYEP
jgi:hypothetical protein